MRSDGVKGIALAKRAVQNTGGTLEEIYAELTMRFERLQRAAAARARRPPEPLYGAP
jgi:hypothetical protein